MKEEFEKLAASGKIEGRHVAALTQLAEAGCCTHRSWGFGRIKSVDTVFARFARMVRDTAEAEGKRVRLVTAGGETPLDKAVLDRLSEPLLHLITNAIVHGIESGEARRGSGKPEEGSVRLEAAPQAGRVVIRVSDDGRSPTLRGGVVADGDRGGAQVAAEGLLGQGLVGLLGGQPQAAVVDLGRLVGLPDRDRERAVAVERRARPE